MGGVVMENELCGYGSLGQFVRCNVWSIPGGDAP